MSLISGFRKAAAEALLPMIVIATGSGIVNAQLLSPRGTPTKSEISVQEQKSIDDDIVLHLGDVPKDPGPKARLSSSLDPAEVRAAVKKVADWQLARSTPYFTQNWTWSVLDMGFMAASRTLKNPRYQNEMLKMAEKFHWELGAEEPSDLGWPDNNDQSLGQTYLELYFLNPSPEKMEPTRKALDSLFTAKMPKAPDDQFQIWWWWCDTLFMGPGTWTRMYAATHDAKYLDYLDKRWLEVTDAMYDPHYRLYYRDKSWMNSKDPQGKPVFWSRGNGWVLGGMARALEYMPKDYPTRGRYEHQMREMAAQFASLQDSKDGLWHSDLLDAQDYPQPELSGSALITFGLAWGVNHDILDRATYLPVIEKAWRGMVNEIYEDGRLGNVQQTDGKPDYYMPSSSYNFGVGGFLLAGEQVAMLKAHKANKRKPGTGAYS